MNVRQKVTQAVEKIKVKYPEKINVAVVLGSGQSDLSSSIQNATQIPYSQIPHLPLPQVPGHAGKIVLGKLYHRNVALFCGRVHLYEGFELDEVTFFVRIAGELGAKVIILTNAAGGVNPDYKPGHIMLISDHINLQGTNPFFGLTPPNFLDLSDAYSSQLRKQLYNHLTDDLKKVVHPEGVYASLPGPIYETPAEVRMLARLGADAVGMSTVQEAIVARYLCMQVVGISLITNFAAGISPVPLSHEEVKQTARRALPLLSEVITSAIRTLD